MNGLMKKAKIRAIMDLIEEMDEMDMEKLSPKESFMDEMDMPEKKGITIMKVEKSKPEEEYDGEEKLQETEEIDEEEIDPNTALGRLKAKLKKV